MSAGVLECDKTIQVSLRTIEGSQLNIHKEWKLFYTFFKVKIKEAMSNAHHIDDLENWMWLNCKYVNGNNRQIINH